MKKKIYLVTGNHQLLISLKDYISLIEDFLGKDYEIIQSKGIQNSCINFIIDECTNEEFVRQIVNSNSDTIFIYFLTEFFTQSKLFKIKSFNYFSKNETLLLLIYILSKYETIKRKLIRKINSFYNSKFKKKSQFKKNNFNFYDNEMIKLKNFIYKIYKPKYNSKVIAIFFKYILSIVLFVILSIKYISTLQFKTYLKVNLIVLKKILKPIKLLLIKLFFFINIDNFNFNRYMFKRSNGFEKIVHKIDFFLCTHKDIYKKFENKYDKKIFFILNKLNNIKKNNYRAMTISGENNTYRKRYISSLNLKYPNNFDEFINTNFLIKEKFSRYSINPKKNFSWKFSSPMRYILSINNHEIPIVTEKFCDDTSENLFLRIDFNLIEKENLDINYEIFIEKINLKINKHNLQMSQIYVEVKKELELCFYSKIHGSQ